MGKRLRIWLLICIMLIPAPLMAWGTETRVCENESPPIGILWIYVDDMSDWVSCYGDQIIRTPNIDSLAADGCRFSNAFMPAPVCSTTRSALITGQMQTSLGLHHHRTMIKKPLPVNRPTLPELFRRSGFITFNEAKDDYNFLADRHKMYSPGFNRPGIRSHYDGKDLCWLKQLQGKSFFGQIQLRGGKIGGETGNQYPATSRIKETEVSVPPQYPDDPVFRNAISRHYEQILQTDEQVGKIIFALKQFGLWDRTIIFFFTDHGSPLPRSKQFLYDEGIKVPLIVRIPSGLGLKKPEPVRQDLVSGLDISASTLAMAGIDIPEWYEGIDLFAKDFTPRKFVVAARDRCGIAVDRIRSIRTARFRYIRNYKTDRALYQPNYRDQYATFRRLRELNKVGKLTPLQASYFNIANRPAEELYDVTADPHMIHNLADSKSYRPQLREHREILATWEAETRDAGRLPETRESLQKVYQAAKGKVFAPEFDFLKQ